MASDRQSEEINGQTDRSAKRLSGPRYCGLWRESVQDLVRQKSDLELNSLRDTQSVETD